MPTLTPNPDGLLESKIPGVVIEPLKLYDDMRGTTLECWRKDQAIAFDPMMMYMSITRPQQKRGPHEHVNQTDYFIFAGPGTFEIHLWDNRASIERGFFPLETHEFFLAGAVQPSLVIVPPGVVHGYKNISHHSGLVLNLPDKLYRGVNKQEAVDEVRWETKTGHGFVIK